MYTHTHLCNTVPLVWGSLRLASINNLSYEPNVMIKCPDPLNVLCNGSTHLANFDGYVCGSLIGYAYDNVLKPYAATGDWVFVLYTVCYCFTNDFLRGVLNVIQF